MERFYFFTKMRVVLLLSLFTLSYSQITSAQDYALAVTQQNGIDGPACILGAPDNNGAQFWTDGDFIIVRMTAVVPAGSQYFITWRMRSGEPGDARPYLYESSNGTSFNENPGANMTSSTSWVTSGYTATQNFEYLKILKQSPNSTDFDIDAVSYCPPASQANLLSSCEITGYASSTGRVFWIPNFGTDFKPSGDGLYFDKFDNGTAHLRGEVVRIADANAKFLVSIWFNGESDYDEWLAQGRLAHSPNLGDESTWTYYSFDEGMPNTLIGLANYNGQVLYIEDTGSGYGLQLGDGANALNTNGSGFSTWFNYTGTSSGNGDINGTYDCGSEVVTCEITGYESTNGRIFYIPNFGTDFKAASSGLFIDKYSNGTAHIRGQVQRISNSNHKFDVSLWFNNESNYAEWISQGLLAHSPNLGDESTWTYYSFDANKPNTLTGVSSLAGQVLNVVDTGSGYGLQIGNGANALNTNINGISTWFNYSGTTSGNGDINGTINCEPTVCNNVTDAGSICCDQTGCSPFNPDIISNQTLPSGGTGALEYVWLSNTTAGSLNGNEQLVAGADGQSYDPGLLSQTTWFRRCARRAGCSDFTGESNWVKITVENCPVGDWSYDCEDGIEVEIIGEGIQDQIPVTLDLSPADNIDHVVVEAVYKSCNPGTILNFVDQNGDLYPASREVPSGTSSNVWVYRTSMPATSVVSIENQNNEWCAQSFTAYVFRQNGGGTQSAGVFTSRSGYNDIETFTIAIPTDPNVATRNLTVELPISELTADGRYIYVSASAGGVTESFSERIWDFGSGNCCYKLYELNLNNVPGTASQVVVTVDTRHNVHQPANGQSWVLAGAIRTDIECSPVCELECADDVSLECDANTHPDYTGYPTIICDENIDCARPEGDFDFANEHFNGNASDWNFGTGWQIGSGCAPGCASVPNAFIDYSSFYSAYDTKLTSSLFDACCTDEVELSFCLRQDLYGSSNVPGYLDIQYRILGGSWQTVHTYTSQYGYTIDYNDSYALPVNGQQFEVRFRAYGNGSTGYTMGGWGLDNIHISAHSPGCAPSPIEVNIDWSWNDEVAGTCPQVITRNFEGTYNGQVFECSQTLTITDEIPPVFYMADDDFTVNCSADIPTTYAFAMDNCDDNIDVTFEDQVNGSGCEYTINRVFTALDDCGNAATYTQVITVIEALPMVSVSSTDDNCSQNEGTITLSFEDSPCRSNIQLSIDGGATFVNVADNSGSFTFTGLSEGDYDVVAKWGDGDCLTDQADAHINDNADIELEIRNLGICIIDLYEWLPGGDQFVIELAPGESYFVTTHVGAMWRLVGDNWNLAAFDEQYTVEGCYDQVWNVAPDYCNEDCALEVNIDADPSLNVCEGEEITLTANASNETDCDEIIACYTMSNGVAPSGCFPTPGSGVVFQRAEGCQGLHTIWQAGNDLKLTEYANNTARITGTITNNGTVGILDVELHDKANDGNTWNASCYLNGISGPETYYTSFIGTITVGNQVFTVEEKVTEQHYILAQGAGFNSNQFGLGAWTAGTWGGCTEWFANLTPCEIPSLETTYLWSTGETTQSIVVTEAGNYSVIVTDCAGCVAEDEVTVVIDELPEVSVSSVNPVCLEDNGSITFTFSDNPSRSNIEFSLDGGLTYPLNVADNSGSASFNGLAAGTYNLFVRWGNDECPVDLGPITLVSDECASLGNYVWYDTDRDGFQDADETGVQGVTVELFICGETDPIQSTETNEFGFYIFENLYPGEYYVVFSGLPADYVFSPQNNADDASDSDAGLNGATACVELESGEYDDTLDAGINNPTGSLGNYVWEDVDQDGEQDGDESGVEGITVELFICGETDAIESTQTDENGYYEFTNLEPGVEYYVVFSGLPAGYEFTSANTTDDALDSDADENGATVCYELGVDEDYLDFDAGIYIPTNVGDFVWYDNNNNGIQDNGEEGVEGVTVILISAGSDGIFGTADDFIADTQVTDNSGEYLFEDVLPGNYIITFDSTTLPVDYVLTAVNEGGDDELDSDANPLTGSTEPFTVVYGQDDDLSFDAGITTCPVPVLVGDEPTDLIINCEDAVPAAAVLAFYDFIYGMSEVDYQVSTENLACGEEITRTWTATNECGSQTVVDQVITILDTQAPVITFQTPDQTIECDQDIPQINVTFVDNCDNDLYIEVDNWVNDLDCGFEYVKWCRATDDCGNASEATVVITVIDTTPPVAAFTPASTTIECNEALPTAMPVFEDNCDENLTVTPSSYEVEIECGYELHKSWTAVDDCDNEITVYQVITVLDTTKPVFTSTPDDYVVNCDNGSSDPEFAGMPTATDNCDLDVTITYTDGLAGDTCPSSFERTWLAVDDCGNEEVYVQSISINDFVAPVLVMPADITIECTESTDPSNTGEATATDDCSVPVVSYVDGPITGDCPYSFERTWTAIDPCNNVTSEVQIITIDDTLPPVADGEGYELTISCEEDLPAVGMTFTDNCDTNIEVTVSTWMVPVGCLYDFYQSCTATDDCGNSTVVTSVIHVVDVTPPTLIGVPADVTLSCDQEIPNAIVWADDNCSDDLIVSLSASTNPLDCGYEMIRTWSTVDDCGNPASATQVITIIDNVAPYIVSAPDAEITVECGDDIPNEAPIFDDNCDEELTPSAISGINNVTDCGYDIERVWSATDDCDNTTSFSQVIHVIDTQAPIITCPADYVVNCDNGSSDPADSGMATATDECSEVTITYVDGQAGDECPSVFERTWTARDVCGNSSSCVQLITINDFAAPVITCPANITVECTESLDPSNTGMASATDDCSVPMVSYVDGPITGDCPYSFERTWSAIDPCGNDASCVQIITVEDTVAPVLTGEDDTLELECNIQPIIIAPEVSDNCDLDVEVVPGFESIPGACPNNYTEIYTWTATDNCGNQTVRTITIIFSDNTPPVLYGVPDDITISCDEQVPNAIIWAVDNCTDDLVVSLSASTNPLDCGYEMIRTWSTVDECGNPASATQVVTVVDNAAPYIVSAPEAEITVECGDDIPTEAPVFADNCDMDLTLMAISGLNNVTDCGYDIERSWSATDDCDNTTSFSQVIHVEDTEAPIITCPADYVVNCDNGSSDPADSGMATATDACSDVTITYADGAAGDECPSVFERTWTATDVCGHSSSCVQLITINDFAGPVITCPAAVTIECGDDSSPEALGFATATDDCSVPTVDYADVMVSGGCPANILRTWTATDACGNTSSCEQLITIHDFTPPVISGEDEVITLDCNQAIDIIAPTAYDACDGPVALVPEYEMIPGDCPNERTEIFTWSVTDICGNFAARTITVHYIDNEAPVLFGVPVDATYSCDEEIPVAVVTAEDNCDELVIVDFVESVEDFTCGSEITRTWSAEDSCGNPVSATQIITIVDETDPYIVSAPAAEITIECGDDVPTEAPVFADNCDMDLTPSAISGINNVTDCGYDIERTWSATDDCDNSISFSQVIHVEDTEAPIITCPADYVVNCDNGSSDPADSGMATATDVCSAVTITYVDGPATDECPSVFERTWTATDVCGNSSSCVQLITINDFVAPVITCPANITVECTESLEPSNTGMATATDDCSEPVVSYVDGPITGDCPYSFERTWTAIDPCGNDASCVQVITVDDTIAPVLTGQDETTELECNIQPIIIAPEVSDNCDLDVEVVPGFTSIPGTCPNNYTEVYTWTATDNCGNQTVRTLTFIFSDNTAPELIGVPEDVTVECTDIPAVAEVTALDNCSDVLPVYSFSVEELECGEIITRTWTATDECGNATTESQEITVIDITAPELIGVPADITVSCDAIPAAADVTATDNCDSSIEAILTVVTSEGCPYTITRTWTATDACGNSTSESQVINVIDESDPVATFVPEGYNIECDLDIPVVDAEFTDNCTDLLDIQYNESREDYDCGAQVTRTWTATDACENSTTVSQVIDVIDTTDPIFDAYDVEIDMPCTDIDMNVLVTATDNCDLDVEITFVDTHVSGGCAGRIIRDYTAVDNCGNESTAQQIITLVDTFDPEATYIPASYTIECDLPIEFDEPTWFDNCDENLTIVMSESTEAEGCNTVLTRTWTATDHCLNSTTVSQDITIVDTTDPVLFGLPENDTVECSEIPAPASVTVEDNCDMEIVVEFNEVTLSTGCPYTIERTWSAMDDCGNSVSYTQTLTVIDSIDPELTGVPENATVECDNIPAPAVVGYTDNCAEGLVVDFNESQEFFECGSEIVRTWTVEDYCGNVAIATQILTVVDNTDPSLIGVPADMIAECDNVPAPANVTAMDNCSVDMVVEFNETEEAQECGYIITRTWSVSDDCGNSVEASQEITVLDTTLPVITSSPADVTVECDNIPEFGTITAEDNCDLDLVITTDEEFEEFECGGLLTRTWIATDNCGNSSAISQVITIVDTTAPVLSGVPADVTVECGDEVEIPVVTASDICDGELDVMFSEEFNYFECGHEIIRTWRAADGCGNFAIQSQTITVVDLTEPVFTSLPADEVVNCDDEIIAPEMTATDVCDGAVDVSLVEEFGDGCPYTITRTWTAVDACGNVAEHVQIVTVIDEVNPVFEIVETEVVISCDEISAYMLTATDNCDDEVEVSYTDEAVGMNDPNADKVCEMTDPINVSPEWSVVLFGMPFNLDYYITESMYFLEYPDGSAHLVGTVFNTSNINGGFEVDVWFENGLGWDEWSTQDFPTSYKDDENIAGLNYLDWTYYIVNGAMATLTGTGDYAGSLLTLNHAPSNHFYGFQVGIAANNRDDQYGIGGWFTYSGQFMDANTQYNSTVGGAGDFAFDGNCCAANDIERTWVAVDNCGNEAVFVQSIHIVDEEAPEFFNIPESVTLYCGDEIPAVPADIYALDNCDDNVTIIFSEVQSNEFCPFTITRTWTAVDECGNSTTATQVITVEFEAAPDVFLFGYPNPFNDHFTVQFTVPSDAYVVADVYDVTGRIVFNIAQGKMDAERLYQYTVNNVQWNAGAYTIMLMVDDKVYHHKMLVIQR